MSIIVAVIVAAILILYWRAALAIMVVLLLALVLLGLLTLMNSTNGSPTAGSGNQAYHRLVAGSARAVGTVTARIPAGWNRGM